MPQPTPGQPAPALKVPTVGDGGFELAEQAPQSFTMVVFYRGLHCPVCKGYLRGLERTLDEFTERGVEVITVSGDSRDRAERAREEWDLARLNLGYDLSPDVMRRWGLYISEGIKDDEPAQFGEPGLFLVDPRARVYYAAVNSMPFGRPSFDEIRGGIDFVAENDYPARGEA